MIGHPRGELINCRKSCQQSLENPTMNDFDAVKALMRDDMNAVDALIQQKLKSDVVLINQLAGYIINSGGKRLRPLVALLAARACAYPGDAHHNVAAIVEFIHTATLLHDDVVDASDLRRGQDTANAIWGNEASVLVGDFLYSRSFQMMVEVNSMRLMEIMAGATNTIAAGEVMQLLNCNDPQTSESQYLEVINRKTAKLFEAATRLGAVLTESPPEIEAALAEYGHQLGIGFQLVDDVLDYRGSTEEIGKNIGDDLAEGKPTLPLIFAIREGNAEQRELVRSVIQHGGREHLVGVIAAVEATGAIEYTLQLANDAAENALAALTPLPESTFKAALATLAKFSVQRTF